MGVLFLLLLFLALSSPPSSSSNIPAALDEGSSLSVEKESDFLVSPNRAFSAGFYGVGPNAYCFAIWFNDANHTVVWMANRDKPVNGKRSKLSLHKTGNLVLTDAGQISVWASDTEPTSSSTSHTRLQLEDTGNLVLRGGGVVHWQSFDWPTDTLLPHQLITRITELVASRSRTNHSSGFYKLHFDYENTLRLIFDGIETSSVYWYDPWLVSWEAHRNSYNNSRIAFFDSFGYFNSSDELQFWTSDWGTRRLRRLTVDPDGNIRMYSLDHGNKTWQVTWQAISKPCKIHGACGANSLCTYAPESGRRCSCAPGYTIKNRTDWSHGCVPNFKSCEKGDQYDFIELRQSEFYGYDIGLFRNYSLQQCKEECLKYCSCKGIQYKADEAYCYPKNMLLNGYQGGFAYTMFIRVPKIVQVSDRKHPLEEFSLDCPKEVLTTDLDRTYKKKRENGTLRFMLWFAIGLGLLEFLCIIYVWLKTRQPLSRSKQGYIQVAAGFSKFTYAELKKATRNFNEEIGRGGGGVVYKGILPDNRAAAIKRLNEANQGEAEFLAEVSIIGRLNHMNLLETWGYCAEGKHRLLVYEYMEHGSLAANLYSNALDWEKRLGIALGTAKGLAYLHEECLEWVLHCDVKPHNILLDLNYQPKVADFGLSKLLIRGGIGNLSFSRIRGTRVTGAVKDLSIEVDRALNLGA
ncbi:hypothetical protein RJ640_006935 [Escallonia rubra]|uniref:non-specific serine/threonine protein kinase n=1 Tax=Escallonia rubra TaxID=112253 RepID=A0AA88U1M2_9ASTE|nr:hypothetical protein RJ640_006935 [Escallonia rubra]